MFTMKLRGWLIILTIFFVIIIAVVASANQTPTPTATPTPTPQPTNPPNLTPLVTVKSGFGIERVNIFNINTNEHTSRTLMDLPFSFRCNAGDYIQIRISTYFGYEFDGWWFPQSSTFSEDNPITLRVNGDLELEPHIIITQTGDI